MPVAQYIFLFLLLLVTSPVWATTWFISPTGNDTTGTGSEASPWQTLQGCHGKSVVVTGDTCSAADGVYTTASSSLLLNVTKSGLTFKSTNARGARLSGNSNSTASGIAVGASNTVIEGFELFGFNSTAFSLNPGVTISTVTIRNNYIHDIGRRCSDTTQGFVGVFNNHNVSNLLIERNLIHTVGRFDPGESGCSPTQPFYQNNDHGIYIDGGTNITVRNNILYDNRNGWSIQLYSGTNAVITNLKIQNNTFADGNPYRDGQLLIASNITTADIANNIFYQPTTVGIICGTICNQTTQSGVVIRNNVAFDEPVVNWTRTGITFSANNTANPFFTNAAGRVYTLTASSTAAIDKGVNLSTLFTNDYLNVTRVLPFDIGAYEFVVVGDTTPPAAPTGLTVE